ncbi:putative structural protein [Agrobacterium phage OLIVR2]|uniref:Putative structural protein n=1 Tax=Agrobacterium phage OLIVR1 TaxID=2723769 RepID=A0A858MRY2_9CAUD|nr:Gp49 family protein [Xanthomonas campestris]YP_010107142.1 putative structural protein [Agrobacterium phage OLIVR1]QIW87410.1 putative structural protein [Agrobacterium phage OLIVR2]QIW87517.1 putative structural protein [Agrobacterium phage OLIVR3]MCF8861607.1 hypothetical protein [Xanthomonas campestris pv. campestris]QIW87303.1 putative structural protein [Agrobacterium phage OLIVR1]
MQPVTEKELISKAVAPRVTEVALLDNIKAEYCFNVLRVLEQGNIADPDNQIPLTPELGVLTFCVLVLKNGFTVTGQSACADPNNYNADIGNRLAYEDAKKKVWAFMGYSLREDLYRSSADTFVGQMQKEAAELEDKLDKAKMFTTTPTFSALDWEAQQLHRQQIVSMESYLTILKKRIDYSHNYVSNC